MSKPRYTVDFKLDIVMKYLAGESSFRDLAIANGISKKIVRNWVHLYEHHGEIGFYKSQGNQRYSKTFKTMCVEAVLRGEMSINQAAAKYNLSDYVLRQWIKRYNANEELTDYNPKREVYMADARRKATLEERKEITEYCISHDKDYKGTAALYAVSYSQVYTWVKKYLSEEEEGLADKRGHHKTDEEVGELERLRRENLRLKRQLEERDMVVELLKKVKEFEGM